MMNASHKAEKPAMYDTRKYPAIAGDDGRVGYCESCECYVVTVPTEDVPNQELRSCAYCGAYTWPGTGI